MNILISISLLAAHIATFIFATLLCKPHELRKWLHLDTNPYTYYEKLDNKLRKMGYLLILYSILMCIVAIVGLFSKLK